MHMEGVAVPIGVNLNWNQSYSYAHLPPGMKKVPRYWKVLTAPVPAQKGLPHFQDVTISDIKATKARRAFAVRGYSDDFLKNFTFRNINIQAKSAGSIQNAENWTFGKTHIQSADGNRVTLKDCRLVRGPAQR
jgi:hypothetical protein